MRAKYLLLIVLAVVMTGCQPNNTKNNDRIDYSRIAGTWKAEKSPWQVVIGNDGLVKSAVFPMGVVELFPGKTTTVKMKDGSLSTYKSGDFPLAYDEKKRELEVAIHVEKIHIKYEDNEIKGNNETVITGIVSEDGNVWEGVYYEIFDYGPRFPQAEEDIQPIQIKLIKTTD